MLQSIYDQDSQKAQKAQDEPQGFRLGQSQVLAQGDEETPLGDSTPTFPGPGEAQEIHDQSIADHGQPQAHLINPGGLDGALGRAANYWYYGNGTSEEKIADAAGALAHGIGAAQSFEDGNKRTAYHTTRYFLHNNGYGHLSPINHDDEELADHLIGHGEGTHSLEDTQALFRARMKGSGQRVSADGTWGKGFFTADGKVVYWPVDEHGAPHHTDKAIELGLVAKPNLQPGPELVAAHRKLNEIVDKQHNSFDWANGTFEPSSGKWFNEDAPKQIAAETGWTPLEPAPYRMRERAWTEGPTEYGHAQNLLDILNRKSNVRHTNILDEIHDTLDPRVWEDEASLTPKLRKEHSQFLWEHILTALDKNGYDGMEKWLSLVFTGSLTTYQYSDESDVDISLFVDVAQFPEWSRAEMIGVMISECDGVKLPGTPFPLQCFVVSSSITPKDLYKPGLRSGYDLATDTWIVPPDKSRVHDVEVEMNQSYTIALENADKMDRLLRYEPDKAIQFWHQIHKRRQRDHRAGRGDYSPSNITYKMLANRGLFPLISEVSGEYIAHRVAHHDNSSTKGIPSISQNL